MFVLIAYASNEGSDESIHPHNLIRAIVVRINKIGTWITQRAAIGPSAKCRLNGGLLHDRTGPLLFANNEASHI